MTTFTDAHLEKLKYRIDHAHELDEIGTAIDFKALLARLEAAESCLECHSRSCLMECDCLYYDNLKVWRERAGKR